MLVKKKITKVITMLLACTLLAGSLLVAPVKGTDYVSKAAAKGVQSLSVKKSKVTIEKGDIKFVGFKVKADKGVSKKVAAKSSNKKVASVYFLDSKEVGIEGKKAGTATITVTTKAKNAKGKKLSKKIKVTVNDGSISSSNASNDNNNSTGNNQDSTAWSYDDVVQLNKLCLYASEFANKAANYVNSMQKTSISKNVYAYSAITAMNTAVQNLQWAKEIAEKKAEVKTDKGNTLLDIINEAIENYNGVASFSSSNYDENVIYRMALMGTVKCLSPASVSTSMLKQFV